MIDLDDSTMYAALDRSDMLSRVREMDRQAEDAWAIARELSAPAEYRRARQIVILGMGGSAIGGDLARTLLAGTAPVPILVAREYDLPAFVGPDTLVIASSYSGNTEETISATEQALAVGARVMVVTTGGHLANLAEERGSPLVRYRYDAQPRAALGYSLFLLLGVLSALGYVDGATLGVEDALAAIRARAAACDPDRPTSENLAKELAATIHGNAAIVYGGGILAEVARRWKGQFNENAKHWAFFEQFPELNHNAVIGYEHPAAVGRQLVVLILSSDRNHPRILRREAVTASILERAGIETRTLRAEGSGPLAHICSLAVLADFTTYYLALLNGTDPTTIANIDYLKAELAKA
ncbi:MAG: bifunctional phosphoglucose/phosphomannose isomerase [Chloroflexota bacterium]|nr:bifunctional phosphoglucose/phosphomannose isomerase [Chloroflexota bacterium]